MTTKMIRDQVPGNQSQILPLLQEKQPEELPGRSSWNKPLEFVLSCLGYAIGLGNVWRFPYLCYQNGGGAFLVTYFIMLFLMGMPIFLMELVVGQYSGQGPDQAFANLAPIFNGLGYCTLVVITLITVYYMVIISWTVFYFFASFTTELGFGSCNNSFNSPGCYSAIENAKCGANEKFYNRTCVSFQSLCSSKNYTYGPKKPYCIDINGTAIHVDKILNRSLATYEYFRNYVLGIEQTSWENFGTVRWQLVLCLLLAWIVAYFCVLKGVKTSGKAAYFTALFPYVILTALVIQGCMMEGAMEGIRVYITPKWEKLLEVTVWANAASQTFYSFGIGCGSLVTLASYNDFNNNCLKDAFIVTAANAFTSVYAGIAIFSMLGFLAHQMNLPVEAVAEDGPGLAFVAYPEAILRLPCPTAWAVLFFFMLFVLGLGSQFAGIEAVSCFIMDTWPKMRKHQVYVVLGICICCFLLAIPMCFQGGIYLFTLLEWNTASWAILLIGLAEVASVAWCYGCGKFLDDMATMSMKLSRIGRCYWWICWAVITPITLLGVFIFQMANFEAARYESYQFPLWADSLGWMIGLSTLAPLLICAVYAVCKGEYSGWMLFKPTAQWLPQNGKTESNLTLTKSLVSKTDLVSMSEKV